MNPLQSRLVSLRRHLRRVIWWRGTSLLLIVLVGCAALAGLLDWEIHLPALVRARAGIRVHAGLLRLRQLNALLGRRGRYGGSHADCGCRPKDECERPHGVLPDKPPNASGRFQRRQKIFG